MTYFKKIKIMSFSNWHCDIYNAYIALKNDPCLQMVCPEPEQPSMADACCGSLECHCIEGYSRFVDHKGTNYNSYYMTHTV